jgi:hypothetical protein
MAQKRQVHMSHTIQNAVPRDVILVIIILTPRLGTSTCTKYTCSSAHTTDKWHRRSGIGTEAMEIGSLYTIPIQRENERKKGSFVNSLCTHCTAKPSGTVHQR